MSNLLWRASCSALRRKNKNCNNIISKLRFAYEFENETNFFN